MPTPKRITFVIQTSSMKEIARVFQTTEELIFKENPHLNLYGNNTGQVITICPGSVHPDAVSVSAGNMGEICCKAGLKLKEDMRLAWIDHVYWTRMLLISVAHSLPDLSVTEAKLLENPKQIADLFIPYYGKDVAKQIEKLITEHLEIGGQIIVGLKNNSDVKKLVEDWYKNADQIAKALSSLNPYYDEKAIRKMMYTHLDLTTSEVTNRLKGNYVQDIKDFEKVEKEAIMMADALTEGLVKQFPNKC